MRQAKAEAKVENGRDPGTRGWKGLATHISARTARAARTVRAVHTAGVDLTRSPIFYKNLSQELSRDIFI